MSWTCQKCNELNDDVHRICWKCKLNEQERVKNEERVQKDLAREAAPITTSHKSVIVIPCSTTPYIAGREILSTQGVVCGETILGANIIRDFAASITDIVGGRSGMYESKLRQGREMAITEMMEDAITMGADAVVGVDIDYESLGRTMLMVCASGTAVKLKEAVKE